MTEDQKVAYVQAQTVCAMAEIMGMQAENMQRAVLGDSMAYDADAFFSVIEKYGIHNNAVITLFNGP